MQFIQNMLESLNVERANLYLLDMGKQVGSEQADAERFAGKNPGVFVARAADSSDIYYRLFLEVCRTKGKPEEDSPRYVFLTASIRLSIRRWKFCLTKTN